MEQKFKVGIVGAGYVGLTLGVAFCLKGVETTCIEKSQRVVKKLQTGKAHFYEEGFDEVFSEQLTNGLLRIDTDYSLLANCNVKIITIGTPIDELKSFSLENIKAVINSLLPFFNEDDLVILRSTVGVGSTQKISEYLNRKVKVYVSYCPQRVAAGKMLTEIFNIPQIIGPVGSQAEKKSKDLFSIISKNIIVTSSPEVSELAKLTNNTYRDFQFGFANFVSLISDKFSVSPTELIETCNKDYLRSEIPFPGLVGGSCLEKDPFILASSMYQKTKDLKDHIVWSRDINEKYFISLLHKFKEKISNPADITTVGILGGAFKSFPKTDDLRGSFIFSIINFFQSYFVQSNILVFDEIAADYHPEYTFWTKDLEELITKSDVLVVQTNDKTFASSALVEILSSQNKTKYIIDYWNIFQKEEVNLTPNIKVISYGYK